MSNYPEVVRTVTPAHRHLLLPIGLVAGYALVMGASPIRLSLVDGMRAVRRYSRIWMIPAGLGFCYALFQGALKLFFYFVLPEERGPGLVWGVIWSAPDWSAHLREAHTFGDWLHALLADPYFQFLCESALEGWEALAGLFNNVVTTFPFSALAALLLLLNWGQHHTTLRQALRRRFGRRALPVHAGLLACALSAVLKPVLFGPSLLYLNRVYPGLLVVRWSALIDWLSILFEYLFGVCVQVYLILLVYTWLRGLNWTPSHLMDMAIRRFSFVVKWAALVLVCSSLLIDLPRICAFLLQVNEGPILGETLAYIHNIARPLLAGILILFSTMQITLTFHSETLRAALAQHFRFVLHFRWPLAWYLLISAIHLFALALLNNWALLGFREAPLAAFLWSLVFPFPAALLGAWLLASWVSLFKRCETGRVQSQDWIAF